MNKKKLEHISAQEFEALAERLKNVKVKIERLEAMSGVAEEKFKIKTRKKAGTQRSRGCGKDIQE